jgi:hypothetical protein
MLEQITIAHFWCVFSADKGTMGDEIVITAPSAGWKYSAKDMPERRVLRVLGFLPVDDRHLEGPVGAATPFMEAPRTRSRTHLKPNPTWGKQPN